MPFSRQIQDGAQASSRLLGIQRVGRIEHADGLRGLAALWVVLFHFSEGGHLSQLKVILPTVFDKIVFESGHLGVAIFFVISGFVMFHSVKHLSMTLDCAGRTLARRLLRLCPPYWASIAFVYAYLMLKGSLVGKPQFTPSAEGIAAHFVYLQDVFGIPQLSIVYWTLCIEVQFYIAFTALMLVRTLAKNMQLQRSADLLLLGSAAFSLLWAFEVLDGSTLRGDFFPFWYAFMLGVLLAAKDESVFLRIGFYGFAAFVLLAAFASRTSFALAALIAVALLLLADSWLTLRRLLSTRSLQLLGLISYSLYLTHNQVTGAIAFALKPWLGEGAFAETGLLVLTIVGCFMVAGIGYRFIERPSIAISRTIKLGS